MTYERYVEPRGDVAHANEVFAKVIGPAEEFAKELRDKDQKPHNVWLCGSYDQALSFWGSRPTLKIKMNVWNRQGTHGPIHPVNFLMGKPYRKKFSSDRAT